MTTNASNNQTSKGKHPYYGTKNKRAETISNLLNEKNYEEQIIEKDKKLQVYEEFINEILSPSKKLNLEFRIRKALGKN